MKTAHQIHAIRSGLRHLAMALGLTLLTGSAQALTTTSVIDLGAFNSGGTHFGGGALVKKIDLGSLPTGSILRTVTMNYRLAGGDPYLGDLIVLFADDSGDNGIMRIKGVPNDNGEPKGASTTVPWSSGAAYSVGTTVTQTLTAANGILAFDLHGYAVWLETGYPGTWEGSVTLEYDVPELARISSFGPGAVIGAIVSDAAPIDWTVPYGTNVTALAPTFTLSSGTCDKVSGGPTTYDFTNPVVYTVTDGAAVTTYTVTVTVAPDETTLLWDVNSGVWDYSTPNWKGQTSGVSTIFFNGKNVIFNKDSGGTISLASGIEPLTTTVSATSGTYIFSGAPLGGTGSLTKSGGGRLNISATDNTYSGGTTINEGKLYLNDVQTFTGLGTGPVTLNGGIFHLDRFVCTNNVIVNGGSIIMDNGFGSSITGTITNNVQLDIKSIYTTTQKLGGTVSGSGGITLTSDAGGGLDLSGTNTYTGDTIVNGGILKVRGSSIKDSNKLVISGGKVQAFGTETVGSLFFGDNEQVSGTWGATDSGADHIDDTRFTGTTGMVNVVAVGVTYTLWASTNYPSADLSDPAADLDGDGMSNQQEYAFGLNPTSGASVNPITVPFVKDDGTFSYTRTKGSVLTYVYQSSTTLNNPWNEFTPAFVNSDNATPVEEVTVTVPASLLSESKLFLRVKAQ